MNKIPIEIQREILGHCDLSASVSLRDTSMAWRDICSEAVFALKVQQRVPWMTLNEHNTDLSSWVICAKVILARQRACANGQLQPVEFLDQIADFKAGKVVYLEAEEVTALPAGFESVVDSTYVRSGPNGEPLLLHHHKSSLCVDRRFSIDLATLSYSATSEVLGDEPLEFQASNNLYSCSGCYIELPSSAESVHFFTSNKQMVVYYDVSGVEWACVMDKKANMSFRDGFSFIFDGDLMKVHLTSVCVFLTVVEDVYFKTYFLDTGSKQKVQVAKSVFEQPYDEWTLWYEDVFVYNGLLWHTFDDHVVPLVIDLDSKTAHYNPQHIIQWSDGGETRQGGVGRENYFAGKTSTLQVSDMASYTNYRVISEDAENARIIFPGTVNGTFGFWKWTAQVADRLLAWNE